MAFNFYLGGYRRDSYRVNFKNDVLRCVQYDGLPNPEDEKVISIEGNPDWELLLGFLKHCGWRKNYDSFSCDGTQWELEVKTDGIRIKSYGSNNYPDNFDEFLSLLNRIVCAAGFEIKN
jgi:hypothetical protein